MDADGYIERAGPNFLKQGFFESGVSNRVEQFGRIAHVFSTYESRHEKSGEPFARGHQQHAAREARGPAGGSPRSCGTPSGQG